MRYCMIAVVVAASAAVSAQDFDFESLPVGNLPGDTLMLSSQGVNATFTGPGLQIREFGAPWPNTRVLSSFEDAGPIEILFDQAVLSVTFENIINGRFSSEVDFIDGVAYDAMNNVVDSFTANSSDFATLAGAGIVRVVYTENAPGQGFVLDNVSFVVPTPAGLTAMGLGLALAGARRRRA